MFVLMLSLLDFPIFRVSRFFFFFFFNDTATTEIYTLSLHDSLPIFCNGTAEQYKDFWIVNCYEDRKSTRLNSSHGSISYAVFCLKKKKTIKYNIAVNRVKNAGVLLHPDSVQY